MVSPRCNRRTCTGMDTTVRAGAEQAGPAARRPAQAAPLARSAARRAPRASRLAQTAPPEAFFVVSAVFHYLGPAFAVLLFARVDVLGVAWLRIASAALIFAVWRRPWRILADLDAEGRRLLWTWGAVLAVMNVCFYISIDR